MTALLTWISAASTAASLLAWRLTRNCLSYWVIALLGAGMGLLCAGAVMRGWWLLAVPASAGAAFEAYLGPRQAALRRRRLAAEKALADLRLPSGPAGRRDS